MKRVTHEPGVREKFLNPLFREPPGGYSAYRVPILKPPDTSDADKLAGWTEGDWMNTRGSLELWRCQLSRQLRPEEHRAIGDKRDQCKEEGREFLLPDFWACLTFFKPPVLVLRWRCDPEHRWQRVVAPGGRRWGKATVQQYFAQAYGAGVDGTRREEGN